MSARMTSSDARPLIFVTVGTDVFPFSRLMAWLDLWLSSGGRNRARVVIQHGSSIPPSGAEVHEYLPSDQMHAAIDQAVAVVCHGAGPSVLEALDHRSIPIVVPRMRSFREAVDDHQVLFTRRMDSEGLVRHVESAEALGAMLDLAVNDPTSFRLGRSVATASTAVEAFTDAVSPLLAGRSDDQRCRPRVLYIAAVGRSGSTLLERILGEVPGFCAVGELVHLWHRGLLSNERCGCGEPFLKCPFWTAVGQEAFGGWEMLDGPGMVDLKEAVDRHRFIPFMLKPVSRSYDERLDRFTRSLLKLYVAISRIGHGVVVDSSKSSSYLVLLRRLQRLQAIDLRIVHLVRDSRGVAYSTTKHVRRPEVDGREEYMPTYLPARAGVDWLVYNSLFDAIGMAGSPSMHLRYERFVSDPKRQVGRVLRFAGASDAEGMLDFLRTDSARLAPIHSVSGNPMRFSSGDVRIRLDDEWKSQLSRRHRATVSVVTWPLLRRYGYAIRP